jgi:hypothetical protein
MHAIKKSLSSAVVLTTFLLTTSAFAMDAVPSEFPHEVKSLIVKQAAYQKCEEEKIPVTLNKTLGNLALVCKEWKGIIVDEMTVGAPSWKAWYGVVGHENIYQQFLNGTLIYRPNPQSDEGMIQLKISGLINPLEGTFDLSKCSDAGKDLSISTGYRKGMKSENKDKLEIWLAPRFMIEKKLKSSASHLEPIMGNWKEETAPIGILWSWGAWEDLSWYDYLTSQGASVISSKNLYDNWQHLPLRSRQCIMTFGPHAITTDGVLCPSRVFMFICEPN